MTKDFEIQKDIIAELKWETKSNSLDIEVFVNNGLVTLKGFVDCYSKKRLAENVAFRIDGVRAVVESIIVRYENDKKIPDLDLAEAITKAFHWHNKIPEEKIKVQVEDSWVTIIGEVDWVFEKTCVNRVIECISGVKGVTNLIKINPRAKINITNIILEIKEAFIKNKNIDENNILVSGIGATVLLRGIVRSEEEKKEAAKVVSNIQGVSFVCNRLKSLPEKLSITNQRQSV